MEKKSVLFVCMGNICRSPAAEGVFQKMVEDAGLSESIAIDSAGTIGHHAGQPADSRMRRAAAKRGYRLESLARQVRAADLKKFDYILVADQSNLQDVRALDPEGVHHHKIQLLTDFHPAESVDHVPDPYYGGEKGFEAVMDILEKSCTRLLVKVRADLKADA